MLRPQWLLKTLGHEERRALKKVIEGTDRRGSWMWWYSCLCRMCVQRWGGVIDTCSVPGAVRGWKGMGNNHSRHFYFHYFIPVNLVDQIPPRIHSGIFTCSLRISHVHWAIGRQDLLRPLSNTEHLRCARTLWIRGAADVGRQNTTPLVAEFVSLKWSDIFNAWLSEDRMARYLPWAQSVSAATWCWVVTRQEQGISASISALIFPDLPML